jgi:hypothetical protein
MQRMISGFAGPGDYLRRKHAAGTALLAAILRGARKHAFLERSALLRSRREVF